MGGTQPDGGIDTFRSLNGKLGVISLHTSSRHDEIGMQIPVGQFGQRIQVKTGEFELTGTSFVEMDGCG